jgi:hypothetical protein
MRLSISKPSLAIAISIAAMAVAIGGTALAVRAGGSRSGKIVAYAYVKKNGKVVARKSLNVRGRNVSTESGPRFCFKHLTFGFKGAQATIDFSGSNANSTAQVVVGDDLCSGTADAEVYTYNPLKGAVFNPFFIVFYR